MSDIEWNQIIIGVISGLVAAGIAYLISRLSRFRSVRVPIWVVAIFVALLIFYVYSEYQRRSLELTTVFGKEFGVERITIDGKHFVQCKFNGTELIFLGEKPFGMTNNTVISQEFKFEGKASFTLHALKALYNDPGTRAIAELYIQGIQKPK
jgi:hypothetical protein